MKTIRTFWSMRSICAVFQKLLQTHSTLVCICFHLSFSRISITAIPNYTVKEVTKFCLPRWVQSPMRIKSTSWSDSLNITIFSLGRMPLVLATFNCSGENIIFISEILAAKRKQFNFIDRYFHTYSCAPAWLFTRIYQLFNWWSCLFGWKSQDITLGRFSSE